MPLALVRLAEINQVKFIDDLMTNWDLKKGKKKLRIARRFRGKKFDRLINVACQHFEQATTHESKKLDALKHWGQALALAAERTTGDPKRSVRLYQEAIHQYSAAHTLDPDDIETLILWGETLTAKANCEGVSNQDQVFQNAYKKFSAALKINPDEAAAIHAWGLTLYNQASTKSDREASKLYADACRKYADALALDAKNPEILVDWGVALMDQARQAEGDAATDLYAETKEKFLDAEKFQKGLASYNLACLYSLQGEHDQCQSRLKLALKSRHLPHIRHIENDLDLLNVRTLPWYEGFAKKAQKNFKE